MHEAGLSLRDKDYEKNSSAKKGEIWLKPPNTSENNISRLNLEKKLLKIRKKNSILSI